MSDRELLEAAAKACQLPECGWMADTFTYVKDNTFTTWNPLTDDGDALRLAVKLDLLAGPDFWHERSIQYAMDAMNGDRQDPYAATRRAIVRAAATLAPHP